MPFVCESYIDKFDKERKSKISTKTGSAFAPTYEYKIVDGIKQLFVSGEINTQDMIDSYAESVDINNIINKYLNGDESVLKQTVGRFGDFRDCPTTYAEMFDRVLACEKVFNSLPPDIREKFDNSNEKFWSSYGSKYFDSVFEDYATKDNVVPDEIVKESEVVNNAE